MTQQDREALLANLRAEEARHLSEASRFSLASARGFSAAREYATYYRNEARALREAILKLENEK